MLPSAICLMGPTASGKSALALELAQHLPVEIITVDSVQVYCGLDIGTAKPDAAERAKTPHHLLDLLPPTAAYSAAQFQKDALTAMADITAHGKIPLLVGGTMLYFKALLGGLADLPAADAALRAAIDAEAQARGWPALYYELARQDPAYAARISPNDAQRIQRGLEILRLTGTPPSARFAAQAPSATLPYRMHCFALLPRERAWLHRRIEMRFAAMLKDGLIDEVIGLRRRYALTADLPALRSVGYRQVWQFLEGEITRAELFERGVAATRQFAKRQLTWLNGAFFRGLNTALECPLDREAVATICVAINRTR